MSLGQIVVTNSYFLENFSGQKGSAINIVEVETSKIIISSTVFMNNTGSYSLYEKMYALPFYEVLSLRKNRMNFIDVLGKNDAHCMDELASIG